MAQGSAAGPPLHPSALQHREYWRAWRRAKRQPWWRLAAWISSGQVGAASALPLSMHTQGRQCGTHKAALQGCNAGWQAALGANRAAPWQYCAGCCIVARVTLGRLACQYHAGHWSAQRFSCMCAWAGKRPFVVSAQNALCHQELVPPLPRPRNFAGSVPQHGGQCCGGAGSCGGTLGCRGGGPWRAGGGVS